MHDSRNRTSQMAAWLACLAIGSAAHAQMPEPGIDQTSPGAVERDVLSQDRSAKVPAQIPESDGSAYLPAFSKGTWTFQSYVSATVGEDSGALYLGHFGAGYFVFDGFSVNLEAVLGGIRAQNEAGEGGGAFAAGGFDLLARWHVIRADKWSIYLEGGAGVLQSGQSFPAHGTHFNFTPQAGVGVTFEVLENARLMLGSRWHHVSNADIFSNSRNPGYDGLMFYGGLTIPF